MANPYYQISMQLVFAIKHRDALIRDNFRDELHKYIGGILVHQKHKPLAINSMPDHIHIFLGMHPCDIPVLSAISNRIHQPLKMRRNFQDLSFNGKRGMDCSHTVSRTVPM